MNLEAPREQPKEQLDRRQILAALRAFRRGDFSVRIANNYDGLDSEIAETFNEIVDLNDQLTQRVRAAEPGRRQGRPHRRARPCAQRHRQLGIQRALGQRPHRGHGAADRRSGARHRRRRQGRPLADHDGRDRRPPAARRVPAHRQDRQHHGRPARLVRLGSDARRPRGRHRRQARRPGPRQGRCRHLEGPDRQRQRHGDQPDRPGAQHRRGDDRGGVGRPVEEDHRRREGRNPRAEEHHQHDGGPAELLRLRSDARGARGRHRRQARRPGARRGRRRHLEGPDRQREPDGRQPDRPGAQHRRGDDRGGARATCRRRSPST